MGEGKKFKILLAVWQFYNRIHPFMGMAHALKARGHDVAIYTGPSLRGVVEKEGFTFFPFQKVNEGEVDSIVDKLIAESAGPKRSKELKRLWGLYLLGTVGAQIEDLRAIMRNWSPDLIVNDVAMWAPILVLHEQDGIPVVQFPHLSYCLLPGPDAGIPGVRFPRSKALPVRLLRMLVVKIVAAIGAPHEASKLRQSYGLPPLQFSVNELSGHLPLYLIPGPPEFDFDRKDLPSTVHYIGSALWDKNADQPAPVWVRDINRKKPVVVVIEEAVHPREPILLRKAYEGLANLEMTVVLVAAQDRNVAELGMDHPAPNIMVKNHVPLSDLLPVADIVVTNGNSPTVMGTLAAGIPLVVMPSIFDQNDVAWRIQDLKAGLRVPAQKGTPQQLRAAVQRVLKEPAFRERAKEFSGMLARCGGAARGAELIEAMAARISAPRTQTADAPRVSPVQSGR